MFNVTKLLAIVAVSMLTVSYKAKAQEIKLLTNDGKQVSAETAIKMSLDGKDIIQCQPVKAMPNKKGTSVSLKPIKKSND